MHSRAISNCGPQPVRLAEQLSIRYTLESRSNLFYADHQHPTEKTP